MMNFRMVFVLILASLFIAGCTQPVPVASSTPAATVSEIPLAEPTSAPTQAATLVPSIEPSVVPSNASPEPTIAPTIATHASTSIPSISDFAIAVSKSAANVFNVTRPARQPDQTTWVIEDFTSSYRYQIYIRPSRTKAWTSFDSVYPITGTNNVTREASILAEGAGAYFHYDAVMKCYGAKYDVELDLRDFRQTASNEFNPDFGTLVMANIVPVCPE
jgi:hypothetical protein